MNPTYPITLLLLLTILYPPAVAVAVADGTIDAALKDICEKTKYADVCMYTVIGVEPGVRNPDARTVLRLEVKAAYQETVAMANTLEQQSPKDDSHGRCLVGYGFLFDDIEEVEKALERGDKRELASKLSGMARDIAGCSDAFAKASAPSPLRAHGDALKKMAVNCLAIAKLI